MFTCNPSEDEAHGMTAQKHEQREDGAQMAGRCILHDLLCCLHKLIILLREIPTELNCCVNNIISRANKIKKKNKMSLSGFRNNVF